MGARSLRLAVVAALVAATAASVVPTPRPAIASVTPGLGGGLPHFESPYLGHTGSADGHGGIFFGDIIQMLDAEKAMGLKWNYLPIYWKNLQPNGPTDHTVDPDGRWTSVDRHLIETHARGLNVYIQIVVGGNAGGPPTWAGARREGSSAPLDMDALIDFAELLVERYKPGGTLAVEQGWGTSYGVRAWELDNEPGSYSPNWDGLDDDYAEFAVRTSQRIKSLDPLAVVMAPALAPGGDDTQGNKQFLDNILNAATSNESSTQYRAAGIQYAIGPHTDVVSFHSYEQLDALFDPSGAPIDEIYTQVRGQFESYEDQPGYEYDRKVEYWHTEGGYDYSVGDPPGLGHANLNFDGLPERGYRANWMLQWFARGFSLGITKMTVMDAHLAKSQMKAMKTQVDLLPSGFTVADVTTAVGVDPAVAGVYRYTRSDGSWAYLAWATNGSLDGAIVSLPVRTATARTVSRSGASSAAAVVAGAVTVQLSGGIPFSEPVFVVES